MTDEARSRAVLASNVRWRRIFAACALVIPALLGGLFHRQELRLRALSDHGRSTSATITELSRNGGIEYSHYAYEAGEVTYTRSVSRAEAPYPIGHSFPITVLPEDPSLSRPGFPYSAERLQAELNRPVTRGVPIAAFAFFAAFALLCHRAVRLAERNHTARSPRRVSSEAAGRLLAAVLVVTILATGLDPKVRAVQAALIGPLPLGLPVALVASCIQLALFAPLFWTMPHLMRLIMAAQGRGGSLSKFGILLAVAQAPAEHRRSRAIVVASGFYFALLLSAWIALTSFKGI